jgi:predicted TIM-barrel fold metal-dependent hydrolase
MHDGIFVFDNVVHLPDTTDGNFDGGHRWARASRQSMSSRGLGFARGEYAQLGASSPKRWSVEEAYDIVFRQSGTDMAMVQVVPLFDWFADFFAPIQLQHAFAAAHPDRVLFCGGADPTYRGLADALDQIDHQVRELGARSMKFYNGHVETPWRCDDEQLAYPMYEKCRDLGINVLQFHKGLPFGLMNLEPLSPLDLQAPARDFPDLHFIIHHLSVPYFEETVWIANRFPNIHVSLSAAMNYYLIAPRAMQEQIGRLLMFVGVDKILWGSESVAVGSPAPYIQLLMDLEIPDDLRSGYGYPQITRADKEKILGLNFAKLMGVDVAAKKRELARDHA